MTSTCPDRRSGPGRAGLRGALVIVAWLALWQAVAALVDNTILLASPLAVAASFARLAPSADFWETVGYSLGRIAAGFGLALALGAALAGLASLNRWIQAFLSPPIRAIRSVPVVSFIILVLIWADSSWLSVTISCLMVLPIVYANVEEALARRDRGLDELAQVFDFSCSRRWWTIVLPATLPYLVAASRAGLGLAWKAGVSAEVIGLPSGSVGERLYQAKLFLATGDLFCWTGVVVGLSFASEKLVLGLLHRLESGLAQAYRADPVRRRPG
ncbi:MAG: ABC transporter permease subunit [Propionibacteriaceae bacterium]|jgi:NitT/TauT family transport system permease protein|nr:ABC transporter permease subunit [Propionibacteriaceae bacterium]